MARIKKPVKRRKTRSDKGRRSATPELQKLLDFVNLKTIDAEVVGKYAPLKILYPPPEKSFTNAENFLEHLKDKSQQFDLLSGWIVLEHGPGGLEISTPDFDLAVKLQRLEFHKFALKECLRYLNDLRLFWREILFSLMTEGPNLFLLNSILKTARIAFSGDELDKWNLQIEVDSETIDTAEIFLARAFCKPFLEKQGRETYSRLRICNKPDCGKLFLRNTPRQVWCSGECKGRFHNEKNVKSGYMAEYQRKGRDRDPKTYLLK